MKYLMYTFVVLFGIAAIIAATEEYLHFKAEKKNYDLEARLKELIPLEQKETQIKHMEQTLMIQYKISWYEAHYYSIMFYDIMKENDSLFKAHGIDWQIFPAIIRIESNWDPRIVSQKNAKGLMQVLEKTAEEMVNRLNKKNPHAQIEYEEQKTLFIEVLNIFIGAEYLIQQISNFKDPEKAIKAYNGGPGYDKGRKDIGKYRTTVRWEYDRLEYIYRGVMNSREKPHPDESIQLVRMDGDSSGND